MRGARAEPASQIGGSGDAAGMGTAGQRGGPRSPWSTRRRCRCACATPAPAGERAPTGGAPLSRVAADAAAGMALERRRRRRHSTAQQSGPALACHRPGSRSSESQVCMELNQPQLRGMPSSMEKGHTRSPTPRDTEEPVTSSPSVLRARGVGKVEGAGGRRFRPVRGGHKVLVVCSPIENLFTLHPTSTQTTQAGTQRSAPLVQEAVLGQHLTHVGVGLQEGGAHPHNVLLRSGPGARSLIAADPVNLLTSPRLPRCTPACARPPLHTSAQNKRKN